ncbi:uncharacterized protein EV422DRAFT_146103 [Fimicolochytrium jonesii]|uniref:uncharacterized protein n=1 Tax=Fimicolochytrium jonesii TaxID=1396493 RepID=UPI0022FE8683|nr:uncharacterized protein EV422DRAFT_146103 [Fimicolochytrium jonesii]KAI8825922.1 hypothetical protein EV422DRAFT_146103 [Fimicolochytrium jonesii]
MFMTSLIIDRLSYPAAANKRPKTHQQHSDKVFTNIDGDKSGYTVPAGTRSMRVGYGVDMAYFDAETRQGVCFSPISVIISQFKSKSLVGMSDNFLISYYVLIIVCLVNSICIPIALLWGRQNKLAQFTPLNLVYPWTSENSWVLGLMFMSMLSTAFYIIKSYKTFVHLKGYAVVAYPILLIPFLCLVGAFYFAEFVAFHQVQRFQRRSAALLGVWATFCRLLFEFFTLMVAVAAFYESAFVGNLPTDGSTTFFQIAENMPVVLAELLLVCWFLKKALALGHVDYHVDQSGVAGPLKMSFEKDFAYVRELLNNSEQKKRELDIVTARKMRLPEPSLLDNLKSFGKKKDEKKPEGPSKSLVAKILAPFHTLLLKPYREMDSRFRILWILAGWAIWVTMIEYVSLVNSFKEDLGCQASRFTLLVEMVDRAGKFYPAKPADSDPNYLSLTNNS